MATLKITERPLVPSLKPGASLLITQQETVDGEQIEALRRIEANKLFSPPVISTASGDIVTITDGADRPAVEVISHIEPVQAGSGDPSPDNVRAITGWNSVSVKRSGRILYGFEKDTFIQRKMVIFQTPLPKGTYAVSAICTSNDTDSLSCIAIFLSAGREKRKFCTFARNVRDVEILTVDFPVEEIWFMAGGSYDGGAGDTATWSQVQIEPGNTATAYEPYHGKAFTINLPETVYGGALDWGTGKLVCTHTKLVFDGVTKGRMFNATESSTGESAYISKSHLALAGKPNSVALCNMSTYAKFATAGPLVVTLPTSLTGATSTDDAATMVAKFNAACASLLAAGTPLEVVYELETPYTIQLTPQQLSTLKGTNKVWSSTGDTTLTYIADTELWGKSAATAMIGTTENFTAATQNYAIGDFIVDQDALTMYRVTAAIARGEAISPGTNCVATTVIEQLANLYKLLT